MAKRKIRLTLDGVASTARIIEYDAIVWHDGKMACPLCHTLQNMKGIVDIIQYGLMDGDNVHTIMQCSMCDQQFAMHYVNTQEVEETL